MRALRLGMAACVLAGVLLVAPARAGDPATRAAAEASFAQAEEAAKGLRFAEALAAYRASIAADPSARVAGTAQARATDLEAHAEGGFEPLRRLEELRRDPQKASDRAAIEALERDLARFPDGRVRAEARLFVAEAWWRRLGSPDRAIGLFEAALADGSADRLTRALSLSQLVALRRERGEIREVLAAVTREPGLLPALAEEVRRAALRERLQAIAEGVLAALAALGLLALGRLATRARDLRDLPALVVRPLVAAFAFYLGGAAAILARAHDGDARPFLWLGLGVLALDVIARAGRLAMARRSAAVRAAWAAACVVGVAAAGFLAASRTDASYLEGLGL
jgi:hypothetical protein